jgi:hypothetical protein
MSLTVILLFQALYFCIPIKEQLLEYYSNNKNPRDAQENLLTCLADIFKLVKCISLSVFFCTGKI